MLFRVFIFISLIRCVLLVDTNNYANLFRTQRSCSKIEYYDRMQHKCQEFPGGGYLVIVDHSAKCSNGDSGLHTFNRNDFYYVCHTDGVMIGMCPNDMQFNETLGRCIPRADKPHGTIRMYDESENCDVMIPNCNKDGKFPVPSNCSFYYDCQRNNHNYLQYVYKCPFETLYNPDLHRCVTMTKCYVDHYDILDRFDYEFFPKCIVQGQFRTSRHCNLYYRCIPNMDGSFFQIRYECPPMMYYNIEKERCHTGCYRHCDYIPWDKIVKDYAVKHNLKFYDYIPKHTTTISTLNTTITTNCPCSCSSTTDNSFSCTTPVNYTYTFTETTSSILNLYTTSSSTTEEITQGKERTVTKLSTIPKTEVIDSSESIASATESKFSTSSSTEATDSQETESEAEGTISQTEETTTTNETASTPESETETDVDSIIDNGQTSEIKISSTEETDRLTTGSRNMTEINTSTIVRISTSGTTEIQSDLDTTTSETELPTETTTDNTEESEPSSITEASTKHTDKTSTETGTITSIALVQKTATTTGTSTSVPYTTSKQPTTSRKHLTTKYTQSSRHSSSDEYDSYEDFTWDDVAWHRHHRTSKIPYGSTPSSMKPRAHYHPNPQSFDFVVSDYWDDSQSHKSSKSASYSSTTNRPSRYSTTTMHIYQVSTNPKNPKETPSTPRYTHIQSSAKPTSSNDNDSHTSDSNESNYRPVRCYNNRHGGLTCDGVKGKPGGWFELPGYLLRYRKQSGEDGAPNKKMNADVNVRLRYPHAYKIEAYPKQKRIAKKPDSN